MRSVILDTHHTPIVSFSTVGWSGGGNPLLNNLFIFNCLFETHIVQFCQFIRTIVMSEIICTTISCKKHTKSVFF